MLLKLISRTTEFWQMNKFDAFQKALFCTMLSSTTLVQQAAQIVAGQYLEEGFLLPNSDHI